MVECFIPLYLTLGIVLDIVVRLACSCSAMGTHSMKLPPPSFCVVINASGSLELFRNQQSGGDFYIPCSSALSDPALWLYMVFHFVIATAHKWFHFPIIPLTVDRGISSMDNILQTDLVASFTELFLFPQMLVNAWLHGMVFDFIHLWQWVIYLFFNIDTFPCISKLTLPSITAITPGYRITQTVY